VLVSVTPFDEQNQLLELKLNLKNIIIIIT
jgi:hypothetical protein